MLIDNIKLFNFSINNKESFIDEYYVKSNKLIITEDRDKLNTLMKSNLEILENISAYKIAFDSNNIKMQDTIINNIIELLDTNGINFSEFVSYWAVKDISYSIYKNTLNTYSLKEAFLKNIIPKYIKERHFLYKLHSYSFSTLQVVSDSKSHKGNGNSGRKKITNIFNDHGFTQCKSNNLNDFNNSERIFIFPDKTHKNLFNNIIEQNKIKFEWSKNHQNKQTDFLFKVNNKIFIMEHKHMKETGGGQDKQMTEIIDFIGYKDENVGYISFLDGVYFNTLADEKITTGKSYIQRKNIINNLRINKQNYFVNTIGFIELLKNFKR